MNYNIIAYAVYTPVTIGLTIWVARTLHKNTKAFLTEIFNGHDSVALSVNNLLQVGFYLISLGYAFVTLKIRGQGHWSGSDWVYEYLRSDREMVEELAIKLGGFALIIGLMLFLNLFLMMAMRKSNQQRNHNREFQKYVQQQQQNKPTI
jgi:hypothetical protein